MTGAVALAALAAVIVLVLLARWAMTLLPGSFGAFVRPVQGGVMAVESMVAIDARRRLVLVRCDGRRLLLLIGGAQDMPLGWLDPPAGGGA